MKINNKINKMINNVDMMIYELEIFQEELKEMRQ